MISFYKLERLIEMIENINHVTKLLIILIKVDMWLNLLLNEWNNSLDMYF